MGSHSPRADAVPQPEPSPAVTRSAARAYLSFTMSLMSWSAIARRLRCPRSGRAAGVALGHRKAHALGLGRVLVPLEVVVQVVDLPLHPVRIADPELVLVGVAAVDPHLLAHRQPGRL